MKRKRKFVYLKVTTSKLYCFEERAINGWTPEQVIRDWFYGFPLESSHASRDTHTIGNSTRLLDAREVTEKEAFAGLKR